MGTVCQHQQDVGAGWGMIRMGGVDNDQGGMESDHAVAVVLPRERMRNTDRSYNVCIKIL